jgi:hypothetical protein
MNVAGHDAHQLLPSTASDCDVLFDGVGSDCIY